MYNVTSRVFKRQGMMQMKPLVFKFVFSSIFKSLVLPHFDYCSMVLIMQTVEFGVDSAKQSQENTNGKFIRYPIECVTDLSRLADS